MALLAGVWLPTLALEAAPELDAPPERVITLAPNLTELIFDLGEEQRLAAVIAHSNHPPAAQALPRIGDAFRIDFERIVALQPDLVIAWTSGNPQTALDRLEALGIPVWRTEVSSPESMTELILAMGRVLAAPAAARTLADRWRQGLEDLRDRYAGKAEVRYLLQLNAQPIYTVNDQQLMSQLLQICRGDNVFGAQSALAPTVSEEAVLQANPEVILALDLSGALDRWRRWRQMDAVAHGHLYAVADDALARPVPAALKALGQACDLLDQARSGGER